METHCIVFVTLDRATSRIKKERKIEKNKFERVKIDIANFDIKMVETEREKVGIAKHLCGRCVYFKLGLYSVFPSVLVTFLEEICAYIQPTHFIFGTVKTIANVYHPTKNQVRRRTFHKKRG